MEGSGSGLKAPPAFRVALKGAGSCRLLSPGFLTPGIFPHILVELIPIVLPEKINERMEKLGDLPGELSFFFPWIYHDFPPLRLSFQGFHFEDHLRGDSPFLIEHGIGECSFGDGCYFSGDAERDLVNGLEGLI